VISDSQAISRFLPDSLCAVETRQQVRVGAICERDGEVLLHRMLPETWWAVPGGRLGSGETAAEAIVRELNEELGVKVESGPLQAVIETKFESGGVRFEEVGLYFSVDPGRMPPGRFTRAEEEHILEFGWFRLEDLEDLDVRPRCIVDVLIDPSNGFRHLVHEDRSSTPP
jgi:ADP-ribose pyrophosphatase YjhB (NUDIX family)